MLESESPSIESVLSAGLTVASAAVADAGVGMNGLGVGVVASSGNGDVGEGRKVRLDPDGVEAREAEARVTVGCLPALDRISDVWLTGECEVEELIQVGFTITADLMSWSGLTCLFAFIIDDQHLCTG